MVIFKQGLYRVTLRRPAKFSKNHIENIKILSANMIFQWFNDLKIFIQTKSQETWIICILLGGWTNGYKQNDLQFRSIVVLWSSIYKFVFSLHSYTRTQTAMIKHTLLFQTHWSTLLYLTKRNCIYNKLNMLYVVHFLQFESVSLKSHNLVRFNKHFLAKLNLVD